MTRLIDADALTNRIEADKKQDNISPGNYFLFRAYIMNAPTIEPTGDLINRITDAIEAEIHEAWTESDADFIRGMEYAVSIIKAVDIRTDSDTISRQAAVECVGWGDSVTAVISRIKLLPNVQPDRQRGEWIYRENVFGVAYCSNCGYELHTNDTPFCPSCGADMRGGEEE